MRLYYGEFFLTIFKELDPAIKSLKDFVRYFCKSTHTFKTKLGLQYVFLVVRCRTFMQWRRYKFIIFSSIIFYRDEPCTEYKLILFQIKIFFNKYIKEKSFYYHPLTSILTFLFNKTLFLDIEYLTCNKIIEKSQTFTQIDFSEKSYKFRK